MPKSASLMISVNNLRLNFSTTKKLNHYRQTCYVNFRFAFPNLLVLNKGHLHDVHYITNPSVFICTTSKCQSFSVFSCLHLRDIFLDNQVRLVEDSSCSRKSKANLQRISSYLQIFQVVLTLQLSFHFSKTQQSYLVWDNFLCVLECWKLVRRSWKAGHDF